MKVRKAVVPVAGFGTRFLPATKAVPKALIPVLDTPPIHHAVGEAAEAGIEHVTVQPAAPDMEQVELFMDRIIRPHFR